MAHKTGLLSLLPDRLIFRLRDLSRTMGVRVTLFSLAGVALALLASWLGPLLPYDVPIQPASGSVDALLNVLAGAMLPVATFSVSIIVTAYGTATNNATPRATRLLSADPTAQTAVSVFIGAFMFSIVGIVGIAAGAYENGGRPILFLATMAVIFLIAWALLRWVNHLSSYGRIHDIVSRVEKKTNEAALIYRNRPTLGAQVLPDRPLPPDAPVLVSRVGGYVQHIDMAHLNELAGDAGLHVGVLRMPGKYVHAGEPLLHLSAICPPDLAEKLIATFTIDSTRSFDQDIRYGIIVLAEIGSRALSAAVNDSGTAIEVLRAGTRALMLLHGADQRGTDERPEPYPYRHVSAPELPLEDLYAEFFAPLARDGADKIEVIKTLIDCLVALSRAGGGDAARLQIGHALDRASPRLTQEWEQALLRQEANGQSRA
ncbi:MAG: DUF2254 domain-containing protein [Paracoccus sp. (in: a-proteobacteria)]|uniref:DUF2254 domain-containing protein n=1 Tax=Paracoccus sp. TaxID=267 RepID=UPI0026E0F269|nr:DUF2254 domain-containing protein [Paracoccus sp. (in: a-proteobacteria)]MDO5613658.1 DUF2254 domain-containing protein [Paracoccus sp. (in: a-proteobacteria)]